MEGTFSPATNAVAVLETFGIACSLRIGITHRRDAGPLERSPLNVFVYGTLMFPEVAKRVAGIVQAGHRATLGGYRRFEAKTRERGNYPAIVPMEDATVEGLIYLNLSPVQLEQLDAFEFVEGQLYSRKTASVEWEGRCFDAEIYVADQGLFDCLLEPLQRAWNPLWFQQHELDWFVKNQL